MGVKVAKKVFVSGCVCGSWVSYLCDHQQVSVCGFVCATIRQTHTDAAHVSAITLAHIYLVNIRQLSM